jgi:hypothetical protein
MGTTTKNFQMGQKKTQKISVETHWVKVNPGVIQQIEILAGSFALSLTAQVRGFVYPERK